MAFSIPIPQTPITISSVPFIFMISYLKFTSDSHLSYKRYGEMLSSVSVLSREA